MYEDNLAVHGIENQLIQSLMANYSRWGRPIADISKPVQVSITFYLTQLMSLVSCAALKTFPLRSVTRNRSRLPDFNLGCKCCSVERPWFLSVGFGCRVLTCPVTGSAVVCDRQKGSVR